MSEPVPYRYRAFLSYSHRDKAWGKWLHSALEGYRVDKDLVGRDKAELALSGLTIISLTFAGSPLGLAVGGAA